MIRTLAGRVVAAGGKYVDNPERFTANSARRAARLIRYDPPRFVTEQNLYQVRDSQTARILPQSRENEAFFEGISLTGKTIFTYSGETATHYRRADGVPLQRRFFLAIGLLLSRFRPVPYLFGSH